MKINIIKLKFKKTQKSKMGKRVKRNELGIKQKKDYQANGVSNWGLGNRGGFASSGDE